jgi:hypothetical protein
MQYSDRVSKLNIVFLLQFPPANKRAIEIERLNMNRSLRQRQPDKYHGAGENCNGVNVDQQEIQNDTFEGYNLNEGTAELYRPNC